MIDKATHIYISICVDLPVMKRPFDDPEMDENKKMKKIRSEETPAAVVAERSGAEVAEKLAAVVLMDENLLYEVLKYVDARSLATAACVSKRWHTTAQDERLWELICTRHWTNIGCGNQQLRSVVLALGGFRRLHSLYLWPLSKPASSSSSSSSSSSTWPCLPPTPAPPPSLVPANSAAASTKTRWGKDEVQLSLSLLSIRYYEKMNFSNRGKGL